jgi:hypothetical protein
MNSDVNSAISELLYVINSREGLVYEAYCDTV